MHFSSIPAAVLCAVAGLHAVRALPTAEAPSSPPPGLEPASAPGSAPAPASAPAPEPPSKAWLSPTQQKVAAGTVLAGGTAAVYLFAPKANRCLVHKVEGRIQQRQLYREYITAHNGFVFHSYSPTPGYFPQHDHVLEAILDHCAHYNKVNLGDPANRDYLAAQLDKCKRVDCHEELPSWETQPECERGCEELYTTRLMRNAAKRQKARAKASRKLQGETHAFTLQASRELKALGRMANRFAASMANGHESVRGSASGVKKMEEFGMPRLLAE
ncbi:MAG: hypothetical protein M1826_001676 [Phylliscum demangeonii]|nr:MAG: hypothetical protein M1826_001676 [Phylliscum demangeonii]